MHTTLFLLSDLHILSFNTQGLQGLNKRTDVLEFLKDKKYQIYCLQDTHFTDEDVEKLKDQWGQNYILSNFKSNARGVAILIGKDVEIEIHKQIIDEDGNYIILDITISNQRLTLINLYGPNNDNPMFFQNIADHIDNIPNDKYIVCGDYNCILDPSLDCYNYKHVNNPKARDKVIDIINIHNMVDPFRENFPRLKRYTWRKKNPLKQARLDYFLISENMMQYVKSSRIEMGYRSDHSIVALVLSFDGFKHGKSYWKHNNSLLTDKEYLKIINKHIIETKKQYAVPIYNLDEIENIPDFDIQFTINDQLFLDVLLMELRGKAISYSSYKHKERNKTEKELIERITLMETNLQESNLESLEKLKSQLNEIRQEKLKGHAIRSRAKHIDKGEKPTKYFCGLEQHNYVSKTINKVEKEDGTIKTDQNDILKETELFYKTLYTKKQDSCDNIEIDTYIESDIVTKLSDIQSGQLEGLLTYTEISDTLSKMKNDKSPGLSGFSADFFKVFWKQLGHFVLRSLNYGYEMGNLSITQRQGIITCIPKDNKPKQFLKNWRPLTLLDTVYKIASGSIANRFKLVLNDIISNDQTGFLKGRFIGENTRLIYDMLQYTEENDIPGLLILIDFEKAFDSLSWSFIHKALRFLNFGKSIRKWIEVFYTNITSSVIQNGHLSSFFEISRGCRQGDPLSPYIFIICAEFLANKIRQNKNIKGINVRNSEHKISQYADDTSVFLDGSEKSLKALLKELEYFARISGLKVNFDKTQLVWIGSKKFDQNSIKTKWKLIWGKQTFKMLGINFNTDLTKMIKENYMQKVKTLESMIKQWERRSLTPLGKITAIKGLMIPAFNHLFFTLPNPGQPVIDYINSILFNFLWGNKVKIKKNVVIKQYTEGGLKMVNLQAFIEALKLTWIRRLLNTDRKWQDFIKLDLEVEKLVGCNTEYIKKKINKMKNNFWIDVLKGFIKFNEKNIMDEETILKTPIFNNQNIQINGKDIYYDKWFQKGIRFINDLLNENGDFLKYEECSEILGIQTNYLQYSGTVQSIKAYLRFRNITLTHKSQSPFIPSHIFPLIKTNKEQELCMMSLT